MHTVPIPDGSFAIVERDNQLGTNATIKKVYVVDLDVAPFTGDLTGALPIVTKTELADVIGDLEDNSVWTPDKLEGLAVVGSNADIWLVSDNDGLDDALGQTVRASLT